MTWPGPNPWPTSCVDLGLAWLGSSATVQSEESSELQRERERERVLAGFFVFNSVFNFFYLVKINKLIFLI